MWVLRRNANSWVDGPDLANERVGGSEGLKRLRELRADGHRIQQRRHPNPDRDIWQYRLVVDSPPPLRSADRPTLDDGQPDHSERLSTAVKRNPDGSFEYVPAEPTIEPRNRGAGPDEGVMPDFKFTKPPARVDFGAVAVCPRCHARTRKHVFKNTNEMRHKDPYRPKSYCQGCNGWGIVPNKGAIAVTMPEGIS